MVYKQDPSKGSVNIKRNHSDNSKAPTSKGTIFLGAELVQMIANTPRDSEGNVKLSVALWTKKLEDGTTKTNGTVELFKVYQQQESQVVDPSLTSAEPEVGEW